MIDLHLHTTASDGRLTPAELVPRIRDAGITVFAVTDHDTVTALDDTGRCARAAGLRFVPGIEITTAWQREEIHLLGYFLDHREPDLLRFLDAQRRDRVQRVRAIAGRLAALGAPIEVDVLLEQAAAEPECSIGRPQIARALIEAGHVRDAVEAFDRFLADGEPAYVPRGSPPTPAEAIAVIAGCGGISSLAHPGLQSGDGVISALACQGLDAVEAYHSDHPPGAAARYRSLASTLGLGVTGGSDYHAEPAHGGASLGSVVLPPDLFDDLIERAESRRAARKHP